MVYVKGTWAAYEENAWTIPSSFIVGNWLELSGNIPITSIRNDPIRELVNGSPISTIGPCKTQLEISHPGPSLGDYITAIPGRLVRNNLYPFKLKILGDCITMINGPNCSAGYYFDFVKTTDKQLIIHKKHHSESVLSIDRAYFWQNLHRKSQNI